MTIPDREDGALRAAGIVARTIVGELTAPVPAAVTSFVEGIVGQARPLGVLFYGSVVRAVANGAVAADPSLLSEGILDFYVIVERQADWPRGWLARAANAVLPPNVEYHERVVDGQVLRAKVAILSLRQFRRMTRPGSRDISVWSRFSQPVRLVWVRDSEVADAILRCVVRAVGTAALWAAKLGPERGVPEAYWEALYRRTYGAELRVESGDRSRRLVEGEGSRFERLLAASWVAGGLRDAARDGGDLVSGLSATGRQMAVHRWKAQTRFGRPLNVARLIKGAFTFAGGARYLAWKIERHSGIPVPLTPFAERHPLLCAPAVLWRLMRAGVFSR
ncbi:hypothetical protein [Acetobacter fallax]|uniref:Phosphatidate cytidylyltransferase n=1 Tax=Acetobacter fallax TaxID=1737473 RepID=A0ABX0KBU2_9PROT|nr:hypothetical protein [Acetobacter fallax]NHO32909.1 hypothetical protein [Acetobacter fallax]NHO36471.1 hypothetical protein [Acetobacter fallax]